MALNVIRRGWSHDPFPDLRRMQSEMDRLFSQYGSPRTAEFPAVNVWTSSEGVVVMAQLPGVTGDHVDLTIQGDTLTVRGRRDGGEGAGPDAVYHRRERPQGEFARTIVLPFEVDTDSAEAMFSDGVLAVKLARPAAEQPRRINISTS